MRSVKVYIRVRPQSNEDYLRTISISPSRRCVSLVVSNSKHEFFFDHVLAPTTTQEQIFEDCVLPLCSEVLNGVNGTILAYGQTGAGKTYTMVGDDNQLSKYESMKGSVQMKHGIFIRAASYLFDKISNNQSSMQKRKKTYAIKVSILEIYNEQLNDLLYPYAQKKKMESEMYMDSILPMEFHPPKVSIVESPSGVKVPALKVIPLKDLNDALILLSAATEAKKVAEHRQNRTSSRGHVIYTFHVRLEGESNKTATISSYDNNNDDDEEIGLTYSKLVLVDLAGSERIHKSGSVGSLQKEAAYINRSLSFLEQVVIALSNQGREHVPYRQSKLTHLLKSSLGGESNTTMISCIWPHKEHHWETLSTLRFSTRMKNIDSTIIERDDFSQKSAPRNFIHKLNSLKKELVMRDEIQGREVHAPPMSMTQKRITLQDLCQIIAINHNHNKNEAGKDLEGNNSLNSLNSLTSPMVGLEIKSVSHIHYIISMMNTCIWEACNHDPLIIANLLERVILERNHDNHNNINNDNYSNSGDDNIQQYSNNDEWKHSIKTILSDLRIPKKYDGDLPSDQIHRNNYTDEDFAVNKSSDMMVKDDNVDDDMGNINVDSDVREEDLLTKSSQPNETFALFKATTGKVLYEIYQEIREALRSQKKRQKNITLLLNAKKRDIDNESIGNDTVKQLKQDYRDIFEELELVKHQIHESKTLKKRAINDIIKSYHHFSST